MRIMAGETFLGGVQTLVRHLRILDLLLLIGMAGKTEIAAPLRLEIVLILPTVGIVAVDA